MRCGHNRQLVNTLKMSRHLMARRPDCVFKGSSLSSRASKTSASRSESQPLKRSPPAVCRGDRGMRNKARTPVPMVAAPSMMKILLISIDQSVSVSEQLTIAIPKGRPDHEDGYIPRKLVNRKRQTEHCQKRRGMSVW
jgi:hypothetical protein